MFKSSKNITLTKLFSEYVIKPLKIFSWSKKNYFEITVLVVAKG